MSSRGRIARVTRVVAGFLCLLTVSAATPQSSLSRVDRWSDDLNAFASEFSNRQKDFTTLYPKAGFDRDLGVIRQGLASLSDSEVVLALMRLVASAQVAHTTVRAPMSGPLAFRRLPLTLSWFSDGLAVTGAPDRLRAALGTRVVRIGSMTPGALEAAVAPYVSHENEMWLHQLTPSLMVSVELLQHLKVADAAGGVPITFMKPGGSAFTLTVEPSDPKTATPAVSMYDALSIPPSLYRKHLQSSYWYEYLPDSRALYIQYNRCRNDPAQAFSEFSRQVMAAADSNAVDRTIIDLRFNQGGDSAIVAPLLDGLKARRGLVAPGHLFALIGRATFSSGLMAALDFRNKLQAVLVGEPVGEKPNSYGEVRTFTLPHSQLEVQYTTKFFRLMPNSDPPTVSPDVLVPRSLDAALAGLDPTLDAALRYPSKQHPGNPVIPGWYADPEARIFEKEYWIYPTFSAVYDQQLFLDAFSSTDLVTWTKHSRVLDSANIAWAKRAVWAPSILFKNGWYYLFFGANDIQNDAQLGGIGVARARHPAGPFEDHLGRPLVDKFHNGAQPIDPFVFTDDDGTVYLIYGGWRHCNIAKLNADITGFVPFADGSVFKEITPAGYVEGSWMFRRNGKYYFMWSEGGWTGPDYAVAYAIGSSPLGPFERAGKILQQDPAVATGAGHHSVLHAPDSSKWYIVYHRRPLGDRDRNHRVVCIDEMRFDAGGAIQPVVITMDGVERNVLVK